MIAFQDAITFLSILILSPLLNLFLCSFERGLDRPFKNLQACVTLIKIFSLSVFLFLVYHFDFQENTFQFFEHHAWLPFYNFDFDLGIDKISCFFLGALLIFSIFVANRALTKTFNKSLVHETAEPSENFIQFKEHALYRKRLMLLFSLEFCLIMLFCSVNALFCFVSSELCWIVVFLLFNLHGQKFSKISGIAFFITSWLSLCLLIIAPPSSGVFFQNFSFHGIGRFLFILFLIRLSAIFFQIPTVQSFLSLVFSTLVSLYCGYVTCRFAHSSFPIVLFCFGHQIILFLKNTFPNSTYFLPFLCMQIASLPDYVWAILANYTLSILALFFVESENFSFSSKISKMLPLIKFYVLLSFIGMPGTPGFFISYKILINFLNHHDAAGFIIYILSVLLGGLSILRSYSTGGQHTVNVL